MYTEIRKCLAKDYPEEFRPQVTTEPSMPIKDMDSSEYQAFKKTLSWLSYQERLWPHEGKDPKCEAGFSNRGEQGD